MLTSLNESLHQSQTERILERNVIEQSVGVNDSVFSSTNQKAMVQKQKEKNLFVYNPS